MAPRASLLHLSFMQRKDFLRTPECHVSKPGWHPRSAAKLLRHAVTSGGTFCPQWHRGRSASCQFIFSLACKSRDKLFSEGLFSPFLLFSAKENNSLLGTLSLCPPCNNKLPHWRSSRDKLALREARLGLQFQMFKGRMGRSQVMVSVTNENPAGCHSSLVWSKSRCLMGNRAARVLP